MFLICCSSSSLPSTSYVLYFSLQISPVLWCVGFSFCFSSWWLVCNTYLFFPILFCHACPFILLHLLLPSSFYRFYCCLATSSGHHCLLSVADSITASVIFLLLCSSFSSIYVYFVCDRAYLFIFAIFRV